MSDFLESVKGGWLFLVAILEALIAGERYLEFIRFHAVDTLAILPVGAAALAIATTTYILVAKRTLGNVIAPRFPRNIRLIASLLVVAFLACGVVIAQRAILRRSSRLNIAVARFEQVGSACAFHQSIRDALLGISSRYHDLDVVAPPITLSLEVGNRERALKQAGVFSDAAIWGWYASSALSGEVHAHFEPLATERVALARLDADITADAAEFARPGLRQRVVAEMEMSVLLALANVRFIRHSLDPLPVLNDVASKALTIGSASPSATSVRLKAYGLMAAVYARSNNRAALMHIVKQMRAIEEQHREAFYRTLSEWELNAPRIHPSDNTTAEANFEIASSRIYPTERGVGGVWPGRSFRQ